MTYAMNIHNSLFYFQIVSILPYLLCLYTRMHTSFSAIFLFSKKKKFKNPHITDITDKSMMPVLPIKMLNHLFWHLRNKCWNIRRTYLGLTGCEDQLTVINFYFKYLFLCILHWELLTKYVSMRLVHCRDHAIGVQV